jgi:tetratricopeptide (TPR) repeat protein
MSPNTRSPVRPQMRGVQRHCAAWAALLFAAFFFSSAPRADAETTYATADEAFSAGAKLYNQGNYAGSREPFEAALRLAPDDKFRVKVYDALLAAYRHDPKIDPFVEACEFILEKSDSAAKRSLTRRALLSFVNERGKVDDLAKRYEERLQEDPDDRTSLYVLSELYSRLKRNPKRAVEVTERLAKLAEKAGQPLDVLEQANLAGQYVSAKKFKEGAELYEKIAPLDEKLAAWHWKEAAAAWLATGDKARALAAAKHSADSAPEERSDQLAHFWRRGLGDVFLAVGEPKLAIPHYEAAIEKTAIQGYIDACKKSLAEARAKAGE